MPAATTSTAASDAAIQILRFDSTAVAVPRTEARPAKLRCAPCAIRLWLQICVACASIAWVFVRLARRDELCEFWAHIAMRERHRGARTLALSG